MSQKIMSENYFSRILDTVIFIYLFITSAKQICYPVLPCYLYDKKSQNSQIHLFTGS